MDRQNKFDHAIKERIGRLEAEPTARVWAGVRQEIGYGQAPNSLGMRIAAAAAVAFLVGIGYVMNNAPSPSNAQQFTAKAKQPRILVVPMDYTGKSDVYLAKLNPANAQYRPDSQINWQPTSNQGIWVGSWDEMQAENSPQQAPGPDTKAPREWVEIQKPDEMPGPVQQLPLETLDNPKAMAMAQTGNKREIHLPKVSDLNVETLKRNKGAILGTVTEKASSFLGIDASYVENSSEDARSSAFSADFGLFKIKKVKTIR